MKSNQFENFSKRTPAFARAGPSRAGGCGGCGTPPINFVSRSSRQIASLPLCNCSALWTISVIGYINGF